MDFFQSPETEPAAGPVPGSEMTVETAAEQSALQEEPLRAPSHALVEGDTFAHPEPEDEPEAARPAEDSEEVVRLRSEAEQWAARDQQTQQQLAEAQRQAALLNTQAQQMAPQQAAPVQAQPAHIPEPVIDDPDHLLTDGKAMVRALKEHSDYGAKRAFAAMAPYVQTLQAQAQSLGPLRENSREMARLRAREMAPNQGIPAEEFDGLFNEVHGLLTSGVDENTAWMNIQNPETLLLAAQKVKMSRNGYAPIQKPSQAPPSPPPSGPGRRVASGRKPREIVEMEDALGVTFNKREMAEIMADREKGAA